MERRFIGSRVDKIFPLLGREGPCRMSYIYKRLDVTPGDNSIRASLQKMVLARVLRMTTDEDPMVALAQPLYEEPAYAAERYWEYLRNTRPRKPDTAKPKPKQSIQPSRQTIRANEIFFAMATQGAKA